MRDQPISRGVDAKPRMVVPRVCVGIIMVMWVLAGFGKVRDMDGFVQIITEHRVLPQELFGLMWWVGPGELVLGLLLVFVMGSELTKAFGKMVLLVSMVSIIGFTYYLSLVDSAVLRESGCGCLDAFKRVDFGIEGGERIVKYTINGLLVLLHLIALIGPGVIERGHADRVRAAELEG